MKNKIISYFFIIHFFLIVSAYAQEKSDADNVVAKMETVLNLTQQQVDLLKPIVKEYTARRHQIIQNFKEKGTFDKSVLYIKLKQLKEEENQKLGQVFTQVQMKQWIDHQILTQTINGDESGVDSNDIFNQGGMSF